MQLYTNMKTPRHIWKEVWVKQTQNVYVWKYGLKKYIFGILEEPDI